MMLTSKQPVHHGYRPVHDLPTPPRSSPPLSVQDSLQKPFIALPQKQSPSTKPMSAPHRGLPLPAAMTLPQPPPPPAHHRFFPSYAVRLVVRPTFNRFCGFMATYPAGLGLSEQSEGLSTPTHGGLVAGPEYDVPITQKPTALPPTRQVKVVKMVEPVASTKICPNEQGDVISTHA